jgi:hypothetical protein
LAQVLLEDTLGLEEVDVKGRTVHTDFLRRNYLENLQNAKVVTLDGKGGATPSVRKVLEIGDEELWHLKYLSFIPGNNVFEAYVMDFWQDKKDEPQFTINGGEAQVSASLLGTLKYGAKNAAWFMLKQIDDSFPSLHPVHISRGIIGPFEGIYSPRNEEVLGVCREILAKDPDFKLLRFKRQYSLAPNDREEGKEMRQVIHMQDWNDEILVCPGQYRQRVADSVLGTSVKVVEPIGGQNA